MLFNRHSNLKMNYSNNIAYCISEYINRRYNIAFDERICYLLTCSSGIQMFYRDSALMQDKSVDIKSMDKCYIESFNPLALETFSTNIRAILRIDHNNDLNDIKWVAYDFDNFNSMKTLVLVSSNIFNDKTHTSSHPIYGLVHLPKSIGVENDLDEFRTQTINIDFKVNSSKKLNVGSFCNYWSVSGTDIFNANRYVIIPPKYNDFEKVLPYLLKNSFINQLLIITEGSGRVGSQLFYNLKNDLLNDTASKNLLKHINILQYSFRKGDILGVTDMDKGLLANCFEYLYQLNLIKSMEIVDTLRLSSRAWIDTRDLIKTKKKISIIEITEIYDRLYHYEFLFEQHLKKVLSEWN
jgi:hypothetical protein